MSHEKRTLTVDLKKDSDLEGLSIGEDAVIMVTGRIIEMEVERPFDFGPKDKGTFPPTLRMEVQDTKVQQPPEDNVFSELSEDNDD